MARYGRNVISKIKNNGVRLDASAWHKCCQCDETATAAHPLIGYNAIVDMGKRVARPETVKFYAHAECVQVNEVGQVSVPALEKERTVSSVVVRLAREAIK